jgi:outer membrane protein assembly factor BamA
MYWYKSTGDNRVIVWILVFLLSACAAAQDHWIVRGIEYQGLRHTRQWVARRELRFAVGDTISTLDLAAARKRLLNLPIFNSVDVSADSSGYVAVKVVEGWPLWPALTLDFSEGQLSDVLKDPASFSDRVTVKAGAAHLNFRGSGATVYAVAQFGAANGFDVGYRTRWLAPGWPLALRMNMQNLRVLDRHSSVMDSTRHLRDVQYTVNVATREGAPSRLGMQVMYHAVIEENLWPAQGRTMRTLLMTPYVIIDRRDLEWYPTRGGFATVVGDFSTGDAKFIRSRGDLRGYFALSASRFSPVLAMRFSGATSTSSTPAWAHYYYGFNLALRGYHGVQSESANYLTGDMEFRFPLSRESTYDLPYLGSYGKRLPWGVYGMVYAQRTELILDGRRDERFSFGAGFYIRVPYVQIVQVSCEFNRRGHYQLSATNDISF